MIPFPFNDNRFSFFLADHLLVGQSCTNPKSNRSLLSCLKVTQCSKSEIGDAPLYNSCSLLIQVMTTGMQIQTVQRLRAQLNASDDPLEAVERKPKAEDTARKARTKEFIEKVQAIIDEIPQRCGDPLVQSGGRWQTLGVAAGLAAGPQVQRDPGLASEGVLQLCTILLLLPSSLTWTHWTTSFGHTSRTSPTWPPTRPKPAWSPPSAEFSPRTRRRLWKRHAPSSGSVSRRWLRLKAATLNQYQLYYIIKLPELSFKIKL